MKRYCSRKLIWSLRRTRNGLLGVTENISEIWTKFLNLYDYSKDFCMVWQILSRYLNETCAFRSVIFQVLNSGFYQKRSLRSLMSMVVLIVRRTKSVQRKCRRVATRTRASYVIHTFVFPTWITELCWHIFCLHPAFASWIGAWERRSPLVFAYKWARVFETYTIEWVMCR